MMISKKAYYTFKEVIRIRKSKNNSMNDGEHVLEAQLSLILD